MTLIFILSIFISKVVETASPWLGGFGVFIILILGGALPTYFLIATILSLLGLQRLIISDESFLGSMVKFPVWYFISFIMLAMMVMTGVLFQFIFVIVGFLGWIIFQAYLASRSSLRYAESISFKGRGKLMFLLYSVIYFFNYVIIIGALIFTVVFINPAIISTSLATLAIAVVGALFACGFNFINGMIQIRERNKRSIDNVVMLGLFISLYSAYFIYNVVSGASFGDPIKMLPEIILSIVFILYAISNVGLTLTARSDMDTRWKLSKETGGSFTFFLASSYSFVIVLYTFIFIDPTFAASFGDIIKLLLFPLVAIIMELIYIRRWREEPKPVEAPTPVEAQEEPEVGEATPEEPSEEPEVGETAPEDIEPEEAQPGPTEATGEETDGLDEDFSDFDSES